MDISWLQTFVIAAEEGNFHKTAERLHLAQPTVTQHIQKLESVWGVHLFERIGRGVQVSRAGHRFLVHAKSMLQTYVSSLEDMARWQQGYDNSLKIIASPVVATTLLPRWLHLFSKLYPSLEFSVQVADSESILQSVLHNEADLGLSRIAVAHPQISCSTLYSDPVTLIAPRDEYDFEGPARTFSDLIQQYPLFTHHHPGYWNELLLNLRKEFPVIRTIHVNQGHVALDWVSEKLGISFFSRSTVYKALLRGNVEEIPFSHFSLPSTHSYLLMPLHPIPFAQKFMEYIHEYIEHHN